MIYLASPYSHPDAAVRESRFEAALRYSGFLMQQGLVVFSPIVYGHSFHTRGMAGANYEAWKDFNDHMLLSATELRLLLLPGYQDSRGMKYEWRFAQENGIRIVTTMGLPAKS